jgi:hypothetical protein
LAGVEGHGDEGVPERVPRDALGDSSGACDAGDDVGRTAPIEPQSVPGHEQGSGRAVADGGTDGPRGAVRQANGLGFASFADQVSGPLASVTTEVFDVEVAGLRDAQAVEAEQADQGVGAGSH